MDKYILDDGSAVEYKRLDLMSKILDPWTRTYLTQVGVGAGWDCLEIGGGNGSVTEWLAATVGPSGTVTSIDIKPTLLELIPAQNLTVRQMDIRTSDLGSGAYDLVTCRAVLHQIAEHAPDVLARMAGAVKPGGWLVIQEPDFHLAPTTEPELWAELWTRLIEWGHRNGVDWLIGRRLPGMMSTLGFGHPLAKTDVQNIRGGDRGAVYFQLFFDEVRDRVVESGLLDAATFEAASALLDDPNQWLQCWMMTAAWARRPVG